VKQKQNKFGVKLVTAIIAVLWPPQYLWSL